MTISFLNKIRGHRWYLLGRRNISKQIKAMSSKGRLKINLGAGLTKYEGWISTDIPHFDILKEDDWNYFFGNYQIDNLLAEHVLEHFTDEQVARILSFSYKFLKQSGCLRIAVPDGYHPDPDYIKVIAPPYHGHQSIWNIDAIQTALTNQGFHVSPLEYHSKKGMFMSNDFDFANGFVLRSKTKGYKMEDDLSYSSLIVDAYKNESSSH